MLFRCAARAVLKCLSEAERFYLLAPALTMPERIFLIGQKNNGSQSSA
jgi:hypothetical protein